MTVVEAIQVGSRLPDKRIGRERQVRAVERLRRVIKIWFEDSKGGALEAFVYPVSEAEQRFELLAGGTAALRADYDQRMTADSLPLRFLLATRAPRTL